MGRKIPGKKHRGVKDPNQQKRNRENKTKHKVNALPSILDDQEVPRKLREMHQLREQVEKKAQERRNRRKMRKMDPNQHLLDSSRHMGSEMKLSGMTRPLNPIPVFKQEPGESRGKFYNRMNDTVRAVIKKKEYEIKFGVEVSNDPKTGQSSVKDREKDEIDLELEKIANKKKERKGIQVRSKEEKRQLRRLKEKEKRMKKNKKMRGALQDLESECKTKKEFGDVTDEVRFNDVAMEPPKLSQIKTKPNNDTNKRSKVESLLLVNKMKNKKDRQNMSLASKKNLEEERLRVVQEYRSLKAKANK